MDQVIANEYSASALTYNAFRILGIPADIDAKSVYRQQQRIQNALELGEDGADFGYRFMPKLPLSPESVLEAVNRVEKQRAIEELFWIHELSGKFDFNSVTLDDVLQKLRDDAKHNTTKGSVAQHNLAVILTSLAQNLSGTKKLGYWRDAALHWNATLSNSVFWQFLEDREELSSGNSPTANDLRNVVRCLLRRAVVNDLERAIDDRDYNAIGSLAAIIREYGALFDSDATLREIGACMARDASAAVGGVLDRISTINTSEDKALTRTALLSAEAELRAISVALDATIQAVAEKVIFGDLYDARATALRRLSVAYFNLLEDETEALRLVLEAGALACDLKLKREIEDGCRHIRRSIAVSEAMALLDGKQYADAQDKLTLALTLSTDEQKSEIEKLQKLVHRTKVFGNLDSTKSTPSLQTFNGIGATFYGRRDFDSETKSYITVHWFVLLFLPIIPLACYRVSDSGKNRYTIYGRLPLTPYLRKYRWIMLATIAVVIIVAMINNGSSASSGSGVYTEPSSAPTASYSSPENTSDMSEKNAIETERSELKAISDSLAARKQQIDDESAELDRMQSYVRSVKDTYTEETIPEHVRSQYNATVDDYNSKRESYNASVQSYNADLQQYKERIAAFNDRVDRYNAGHE